MEVLKSIKLLLLLVSLGYFMVWVLRPTNLWRKNWMIEINNSTSSTFFQSQGAILLIFTFPVLFIAVLGCIYLHLQDKKGTQIQRKGNQRLAVWKRPLLIKGPLGVVSALEVTFLLLVVGLLVWSLAAYLTINFTNLSGGHQGHGHHDPRHENDKMWQTRLRNASFFLGVVGNIACILLFIPVTRGSSILPLLGLTFEASIKYHIWLGHMAMILFTAHGVGYFIYWASTNDWVQLIEWDTKGIPNLPGEISLAFGLAMWITVYPGIRRKLFEVFFYTHQLYTLFVFFYVLHVGMPFFCTILPGVYLFIVDRYLRFVQSQQKVRLVSARLLPCETVELNFSKRIELIYTPTSLVFVNVPSISKLQWHPFTVNSSSSLEPEIFSVIIKGDGNWTRKLYQAISSPSSIDRLEVCLEGPYGPVSTHFLRYDTLIMVSGGSGITPFFSIIRELVFTRSALGLQVPKVRLVCAFKSSADLTMLDLLLPASGTPFEISSIQLQIDAYVTREKVSSITKDQIRTVLFKPNPSDKPFSSILGSKYWLWLAVVISSSFVLFLIFLGILTRYHMYPVDHKKTSSTYSTSSRALLNMLFIMVCIPIAGTAAIMWNKRNATRESKQIVGLDSSSPKSSQNSELYNAEHELESFPKESLSQAIEVHFGARPDLTKILLESEGESVGVMVCGPKEMRRQVATICKSGLADNLHYESLSFSW